MVVGGGDNFLPLDGGESPGFSSSPMVGGWGAVLKVEGTRLIPAKQGWSSKLSIQALLKLEGTGKAVFPGVLQEQGVIVKKVLQDCSSSSPLMRESELSLGLFLVYAHWHFWVGFLSPCLGYIEGKKTHKKNQTKKPKELTTVLFHIFLSIFQSYVSYLMSCVFSCMSAWCMGRDTRVYSILIRIQKSHWYLLFSKLPGDSGV